MDYSEIAVQQIIDYLPGHIYWKDKSGKYLGCNNNQANSLGFDSWQQIVGKTDFDLPWPEGSAVEFRKNDLEVMENGLVKTSEEKSKINGKYVTVLSQKVPLRNKKGEVVGLIGISLDISAEKKVEHLELENEKHKAVVEATKHYQKLISNIGKEIQQFVAVDINRKLGVKANTYEQYIDMTPHQAKILYLLSLSMTPKDIARFLSKINKKEVAHATIVSIIDKYLYPKFGVNSVSKLVEQAKLLKLVPIFPDETFEKEIIEL